MADFLTANADRRWKRFFLFSQ